MCTPRGTDLSDPEYGSSLAASFLGNVDPKSLDFTALRSIQEVEDTLRRYDSEYVSDDDERLSHATLQQLSIDQTGMGIEMTIEIQNMQGSKALFLVPMLGSSTNG